jgi:hypothetical protein
MEFSKWTWQSCNTYFINNKICRQAKIVKKIKTCHRVLAWSSSFFWGSTGQKGVNTLPHENQKTKGEIWYRRQHLHLFFLIKSNLECKDKIAFHPYMLLPWNTHVDKCFQYYLRNKTLTLKRLGGVIKPYFNKI